MNHRDISNLANLALKTLSDRDKFSLPGLHVKLASAVERFPEDQTIGIMADVVGRMMRKQDFVSRAELREMYGRLHVNGTRFPQVFAEELGEKAERKSEVVRNAAAEEWLDVSKYGADQALLSSFASVFGDKVAQFSKKQAGQAEQACKLAFSLSGLDAQVSAEYGDDKLIVCRAAVDTPRGLTSVLVPVEFSLGAALPPESFVSNAGVESFTTRSLKDYFMQNAGNKLATRAEEVYSLTKSARNGDSELSDVDFALARLKLASGNVDVGGVVGQEVENWNPNSVVNLPEVEDEEISSIARSFDTEIGKAAFAFGKTAVQSARNLVEAKLRGCDVKHYNLTVLASDMDSVTFGVSLNGGKSAFKVPVSFDGSQALPPEIIVCAGTILDFSKAEVDSLTKEQLFDGKISALASPLYGLKPSELVDSIRKAVAEENYAKAEDSLNVLAESEDDKAYQIGIQAFYNGLAAKKVAETKVGCKMVIKTANTSAPVCGHTGLTLDKVYQDRLGECRPLYRKQMDDSSDGTAFVAHNFFNNGVKL